MEPDELLDYLGEVGASESADYNDDKRGWFGWRIDGDILTVTFEGEHITDPTVRKQWKLTPRPVVAGDAPERPEHRACRRQT